MNPGKNGLRRRCRPAARCFTRITACPATKVSFTSVATTVPRSLAELRGRVSHWANALYLRWGKEEVEEVATHLNDHYYKFESRQK